MRHLVNDDVHEVVRALSLGEAMDYRLPPGDDGSLRVRSALPGSAATSGVAELPDGEYVVRPPGTSVTARAWRLEGHAAAVDRLADAGWQVVVTGGSGELELTSLVAGNRALNLGGRLDLVGLAEVISGARAVVVGNTGPAHLAAAVGTPVVSLYAPTVPASRWRPGCPARPARQSEHRLRRMPGPDVPCPGSSLPVRDPP